MKMNQSLMKSFCTVALAFSVFENSIAAWAPEPQSSKGICQVAPFDLKEVRLLKGPFYDAMLLNQQYLLSLEPDRLLHTFRITAGLPTSAKPYGGWEDPKGELRGHSLGHYLTACALMHAATGNYELKKRINYIVEELDKCQQALPSKGYNPGFLSAYPEEFFDRVYARKPVWAPYYTLHKIMAGLLDAHQLAGNPQALLVLVRLTEWVKFRVDKVSPEQQQRMLDAEFGGMNEVLANLYAVTGNPEHLRLARAFDHRRLFDPLAKSEDALDGMHANTQIPKAIGAAREYELTGDSRDNTIARFFWERVAMHRSYVIGGHSDHEHFFPTNDFRKHLSPETTETCNTYNMLKLTRHIFAWQPEARVMDFYERALYNHILASQDPLSGMYVYLMPLKPGHFKTYSLPESSFWCCVGTGMENHGRYTDSIYFHDAQSLYVNLFIPSEVNWKTRNLHLRQETKFPENGISRLTITCAQPQRFALKVRWPAWASEFTLRVNGKAVDLSGHPGSYVSHERDWRNGDKIEIRFPISLRMENLPGANDMVALMHGPIVLAGELGKEGMPNPYAKGQTQYSNIPSPEVPVLIAEQSSDVLRRTAPINGKPMHYRTKGLGLPSDISLAPLYRVHHQRYNVYWQLSTSAQWQQTQEKRAATERERKALEARIVDEFRPGEQQSETDHKFQGKNTASGNFNNRKWLHASDGGWFSFGMKVDPSKPMTLVCTYWGNDAGNREFDILVDGVKLATQKLDRNKPENFFQQSHPLPEAMVQGKTQITITFQALPGKTAGGLFGAMILKPSGN